MRGIQYKKDPERVLIQSVNIPSDQQVLYEPDNSRKPILIRNDSMSSIPIIIDYGSGITKAGWGSHKQPDLSVASLLCKSKDAKTSITYALTSSKIRDVDLLKANYRSPYERNIVQQFGLMESLNDFIFNEIGVVDSSVNHPLMISEPFGNPEYCRDNLLEQLFECYEVPSVMIGVDSLFAIFNELGDEKYKKETCLVISIGHSVSHVIPMVDGVIAFKEIKRVNVGYSTSFEILYKQLVLKHTHQKQHLDYQTVQAIHLNHCLVAENYSDQLKYLKSGINSFQNDAYKSEISRENNNLTDINSLQEPILIDFPVQQKIVDESEVLRKQEIRQRQGERLREAMNKKREERQKAQEKELEDLLSLETRYKEDPQSAKAVMETLFGKGKSIEELQKRINKVKGKLGLEVKEVKEEDKYNLINIADSQLTPVQQKQKKIQVVQKMVAENRAEKKLLEKQRKEEIIRMKTSNPEAYLGMLYERRLKISKKLEEKKKRRLELSTRNSRVNQKRMQTIAQLGASEKIGKDDNFGMDDDDWNIYIGIQKDYESDDENQELKLSEIEIELRELDPNFEDNVKIGEVNPYGLSMQEPFIELSVDRFKGNEAIFQPGIAGVDQSGLSDVIAFVLKKFPTQSQVKLLKSIKITGGGSNMKGIAKRIEVDLISNFEVGREISVSVMSDPIFGPWMGMQKAFQQYGNALNPYFISRREYQENGSTSNKLFKQNPFSNVVVPYI